MDPWEMGQRGGRMGGGGGGGGRRPESIVGGRGMGSSFTVVHQPLIRMMPSSQQQGNSYFELANAPRLVQQQYPSHHSVVMSSFRMGKYPAAALATTTIPSLSSGQGFYTVESLEGATMLPTTLGILPPTPIPSSLHDNRRGGGGLGHVVGVGVDSPVVLLPKPYSALHLNGRPPQYGAASEQKENGVVAQAPPPLLPTPPYSSALHLNARPQYGAEQVGDHSSYMDREREHRRYNGHGLYSDRPGPSLPYPNSLGFAFGWPAEREQGGSKWQQKGRELVKDREKGRDRDLLHASTEFQGRGPGNRWQSTNPVPPSAIPLTPRNMPPVNIKPKKKPIPVLGPGGIGWCATCEVECKTADMLQQHLAGKRHRKHVSKLESEVEGGSQKADGSQTAASCSSENASGGWGKRSATVPAEDDDMVLKKPRPVDNTLALSSHAAAPEQCEQESDAGCRSSGISTTMPLSATTIKSPNGSDDGVTTSNGVGHVGGGGGGGGGGCGGDGDGSRTLNGGSDVGTTSSNGDDDGCTTSTINVEKVAKSARDKGDKEDIWKTMPPEDLVRSDIGEAVKLLEVLIDNR